MLLRLIHYMNRIYVCLCLWPIMLLYPLLCVLVVSNSFLIVISLVFFLTSLRTFCFFFSVRGAAAEEAIILQWPTYVLRSFEFGKDGRRRTVLLGASANFAPRTTAHTFFWSFIWWMNAAWAHSNWNTRECARPYDAEYDDYGSITTSVSFHRMKKQRTDDNVKGIRKNRSQNGKWSEPPKCYIETWPWLINLNDKPWIISRSLI